MQSIGVLSEGGWMELRKKIWDQLEEKKQLLSRRPPYKLIPNFKVLVLVFVQKILSTNQNSWAILELGTELIKNWAYN